MRLIKSFRHAYNGLVYAFSKELNLRLELLAAMAVVAAMVILQVERWEAVSLLAVIFAVLILEMVNTLVERLVNIFKPRMHPYAKVIKDMMAAIVLLASFAAILVGIIIFWPYIVGV